MSTEKATKINQLLASQSRGIVFLSSWLSDQGYSLDLQKKYRKNSWLKSIGTGAMIRLNDAVTYRGAVYSLQKQSNLNIHIGGKTALSLLGKSHYLELSYAKVTLFGGAREKLPTWFKNYDWNVKINYHSSSFLPINLGFVDLEFKTFSMKISGAARAIMECLYLVPDRQPLMECFELMENLNNLHPRLVQELLEKCTSIKVKRLFLYLAEKANHSWMDYIKIENIDLGSGKRSIVKNGIYVPKHKITVPKELEDHGKQDL
jgi:hypothetical protein